MSNKKTIFSASVLFFFWEFFTYGQEKDSIKIKKDSVKTNDVEEVVILGSEPEQDLRQTVRFLWMYSISRKLR
jgi:hypothetical protein